VRRILSKNLDLMRELVEGVKMGIDFRGKF
jgi:hypothetical protein